jgi:hypothetical protein
MPVFFFAIAIVLIYLAISGKLAAMVYVLFNNKQA